MFNKYPNSIQLNTHWTDFFFSPLLLVNLNTNSLIVDMDILLIQHVLWTSCGGDLASLNLDPGQVENTLDNIYIYIYIAAEHVQCD